MFALWVFGISVILDFVGPDILGGLFSLAVLLPSLGLGARRLHDVNLSGWWQLIGIIPVIGWIILIILLAKPSEAGVNAYDKVPQPGEAGTGDPVKTEAISSQVNKVVDTMKSTINKVSSTLDLPTKSNNANTEATNSPATETPNSTPAPTPEEPKA